MWKVLIADDENLICRLVQALVDWDSLEMELVGTAGNGLDALRLIKECMLDILITDIRMPGCSGLELIKEAKEINPELEIIIISGYAHFEYAKSAISYGVGNYLLKPIKQPELLETLQKIRQRLTEKKGIGDSVHKNSQNDLNRLRERLIQDMLEETGTFTMQGLREVYHFMAKPGQFQAFILRMDCDRDKLGRASFAVIEEKVKEVFENTLSSVCEECLIGFLEDSGYGVLNYVPERKDAVRRQMREFLKALEGSKCLFGNVDFTLALGSAGENPTGLFDSVRDADMAVAERILEGVGRMLENVPPVSGVSKQAIMDKYIKTTEHAIEVLDLEEEYQADDEVRAALMEVKDIRGREILDIVLSAGRFFIFRTGMEKQKQIQQDFDAWCRQCGNMDGLFMVLRKFQKELMTELIQMRENESSRPVRAAKQYIMQNFDKNITLEEVCEYVGFSTTYFSVMFKKETGEGFVKYLTRIRMEEAKNLLRETGLSVSEICEKVGYSDRKHFTHTFHKFTGVNPAEYRKLYG